MDYIGAVAYGYELTVFYNSLAIIVMLRIFGPVFSYRKIMIYPGISLSIHFDNCRKFDQFLKARDVQNQLKFLH